MRCIRSVIIHSTLKVLNAHHFSQSLLDLVPHGPHFDLLFLDFLLKLLLLFHQHTDMRVHFTLLGRFFGLIIRLLLKVHLHGIELFLLVMDQRVLHTDLFLQHLDSGLIFFRFHLVGLTLHLFERGFIVLDDILELLDLGILGMFFRFFFLLFVKNLHDFLKFCVFALDFRFELLVILLQLGNLRH